MAILQWFGFDRDYPWTHYAGAGWTETGSTTAHDNTEMYGGTAKYGAGSLKLANANGAVFIPHPGGTAPGISLWRKQDSQPDNKNLLEARTGTTVIARLRHDSGVIELQVNGSVVYTGTSIPDHTQWHRMTLEVYQHATNGEVRFDAGDGVIVTWTGAVTGSAIDNFKCLAGGGIGGVDCHIDHVVLTGELGDTATPMYVGLCAPDGDDDDGGRTRSDTGTGTDLFEVVDSVGTDYANGDSTDTESRFTVEDLSDVDASWTQDNFHGVGIEACVTTITSSTDITTTLTDGGGAQSEVHSALSTGDYLVMQGELTDQGGSPWTSASIDATKVGVDTTSTNDEILCLAMSVLWSPGSGGNPMPIFQGFDGPCVSPIWQGDPQTFW